MQLKRWVPLLAMLIAGVARANPPDDAPQSDDTPLTDDEKRDVFDSNSKPTEATPASSEPPPTGAGRLGFYHDSDKTTVLRALAQIAKTSGNWLLSGSVGVDSVTSASIDVRSSPLGAVDTVTSASGRSSTSGGQMTDTRYQLIAGAGWNDTHGLAANLTSAVAAERDYQSVSIGLNGSVDVDDRNATLLGGFTLTDNRISSVLDPMLHRKMYAIGWSAGVARVLTRYDALRLRYDGKASEGYQASPYRNVRFGDWTTSGRDQLTFANTIGSPDGLPETLPESRISHAAVLEWVHSLASGVGIHPQVRVGHDSWGIDSVTASVDLRVAKPHWRMQLGYRFYHQLPAEFFEGKYTMDPSMYTYYTSDKELGRQTGHVGSFDITRVLIDADGPNDTRMMFNARFDVLRYTYPGFPLLASRVSTFVELGLSWEL